MQVSKELIDQMFSNDYFRQSFESLYRELLKNEFNRVNQVRYKLQADEIMDQITQLLENNIKSSIEQSCQQLYSSILQVDQESVIHKNKISASSSSKKLSTEIQQCQQNPLSTSIFESSQLQINSINHNFVDDQQVNCLESKDDQLLIRSFGEYKLTESRKRKEVQFEIADKVHEEVQKIQEKYHQRMSEFQQKVELMIEQLKKTITSVVQAMNDPEYWHNQKEKTPIDSIQYQTIQNPQNSSNIKSLPFTKSQESNQKNSKSNLQSTNQVSIQKDMLSSINRQTIMQQENISKQNSPKSTPPKASQSTFNKTFNFGIKSLLGFKSGNKKVK